MRHLAYATLVTSLIVSASQAEAQNAPSMIPFGGTAEMRKKQQTPPATSGEKTRHRLLTLEEFSDLTDAASREPHRKPVLTEDEIEDILATFIGVVAGEIAVNAITRPLGGGISRALKTGRVRDLKLGSVEDGTARVGVVPSVEEVAAAYFRLWWRSRGEQEQLARLMAEAGVHPERIDFDPNNQYRGARGYMDLWVELLEITNQQHIISQMRKNEASLPHVWLTEQIRSAKAARDDVYAASGLKVPEESELSDEQKAGKAALDAWRQRLEASE